MKNVYTLLVFFCLLAITVFSTFDANVQASIGIIKPESFDSVLCVTAYSVGTFPNCFQTYTSIQSAVDAAGERDIIKLAAGVYNDVSSRPAPVDYQYPPGSGMIDQVVYIDKSVSIYGGYSAANGFADPPNPDQLSLLLLGTEYRNASIDTHLAITAFGSGCGQLAAAFGNIEPDVPKAIIGTTDIAMRQY